MRRKCWVYRFTLHDMKILFILELFQPHIWWVEVLFDNLTKWLIAKGHKVTILTSRFDTALPKYEKRENGIEIHRVGHNRYDFMLHCLRKGIALARKHDIIHTTTYNAAIPASIIGKITKKKVVITVHEIFWTLRTKFMGRRWRFYKKFENLIFRFPFDKYICVSHYTKNCLRVRYGISDNKLITIYNGIDYNLWDKNSFRQEDIDAIRAKYDLKNNYTWLFFGRPGISKWLSAYISAIPEIISQIPHFKAFFIVWESANNPADKERKLIHDLHISKHIIRIPWVKYTELGNYMLACDCVIVPSLAEGFWFAAAETCALEKELVVSNVASLPEVVSGKVNFVEPGNSKDIAEKVIRFYEGKYESIPRKEFLWKENVEKMIVLYGLLSTHAR